MPGQNLAIKFIELNKISQKTQPAILWMNIQNVSTGQFYNWSGRLLIYDRSWQISTLMTINSISGRRFGNKINMGITSE